MDTAETRETTNKWQDWQERATQRARDLGYKTDQYVRDNAWMTIGIAALAGCIIGYLIANRDSD